jgi:N,N'-diacetyllegionaminate synthase
MSKVFVIAEAGVNHNGSIELAKKLIDVAAQAGANAVKFQTFKTENLVSKNAQKAERISCFFQLLLI